MSRLLDSEDVLDAICNALMCYSDCGITEGREIAEDVVDGIRTACEQVTGKSDLIYRQDAIEALGEEPPVWNDEYHEIAERNQWRSDVAAIEAVPSAQPDKTVIDKCLFKINSHISPHTSTPAVIEIKHYMQELYEEIYGEEAKPKWMI